MQLISAITAECLPTYIRSSLYRLELAVSKGLVDILVGCHAKYRYDFHLLVVDRSRNFSFWYSISIVKQQVL